jgi:hypothetical protein
MLRKISLAFISLCLSAHASIGQIQIEPAYSIWDVNLGQLVFHVPDAEVGEIACGTGGGPVGHILASFKNFLTCTPEQSGLREVVFNYDDEQDYIALALETEYKFLHGGTSVFAHPVIVSLLVDPAGVIIGRRIVTDDRISDFERRTAFTLMRNFKARYGKWLLDCADIPMKEGEQPVGNQFVHERCTGQSPDGGTLIAIEASYLRKKGQQGINRATQEVNKGYFESQARFEEVLFPYAPVSVP